MIILGGVTIALHYAYPPKLEMDEQTRRAAVYFALTKGVAPGEINQALGRTVYPPDPVFGVEWGRSDYLAGGAVITGIGLFILIVGIVYPRQSRADHP